jgi:hypothetical protein
MCISEGAIRTRVPAASQTVSFSLFTSTIHNYKLLVHALDNPVTSIDVAFMLDWQTIWHDFAYNLRHFGLKHAVVVFMFSLACPHNQKQFERNINLALAVSDTKTLRISSSFFSSARKAQGEFILRLIDSNPSVQLTLEQDASTRSWDGYLQLFYELHARYPGRIMLSFDAGHLIEACELRQVAIYCGTDCCA